MGCIPVPGTFAVILALGVTVVPLHLYAGLPFSLTFGIGVGAGYWAGFREKGIDVRRRLSDRRGR